MATLQVEEGHHTKTEADSGDHSAHEADAEKGDEGEEEGDGHALRLY